MEIEIDFETFFKNKIPCVDVDTTFSKKKDILLDSVVKNIKLDLDFLREDQLKITFKNKCDNEDNFIRIKKLKIDNIDLQHFIFEGMFYPVYNKNWYEEQEIKPPLYYKPGTEMRHNGSWILNVKTPIWKMMMEQWLQEEVKNA